jgi:hypothetical protein
MLFFIKKPLAVVTVGLLPIRFIWGSVGWGVWWGRVYSKQMHILLPSLPILESASCCAEHYTIKIYISQLYTLNTPSPPLQGMNYQVTVRIQSGNLLLKGWLY